MNISAELAQIIVTEMKEIFNQDINYIDTDGIIIASTDEERIGLYHGGAKRVLKIEKELNVYYDEQFPSVRKGINIPIYFDDKIVGVIGITGEVKEVEKYGKILKKMTEILIKDEYIKKLKNQEKEFQRMIIEDLLFSKNNSINNLSNSSQFFDIRKSINHVVVTSKVIGDTRKLTSEMDNIYNIYKEKLVANYPENLILQNKNEFILILFFISIENLRYSLEETVNSVHSHCNVNVNFGIGTIETNPKALKFSYEKARLALDCAVVSKRSNIKFYRDMDIELITENTSRRTADEFIERVFGDLGEEEIDEYHKILNLFEEYNGSIKKIAELLYIHKNTLQYRLNRLHKKTGYDMRRYQDFTVLKLAFSLKHELIS